MVNIDQTNANQTFSSENFISILWLDDEIGKKRLLPTENALRRNFFLTAEIDPDKVIENLRNSKLPIDLLLIDVVFPTNQPKKGRVTFQNPIILGIELLYKLRNGEISTKRKNLPVIGLTAATQSIALNKITEIMETDKRTLFLTKPIASNVLVDKIKRFIAKINDLK